MASASPAAPNLPSLPLGCLLLDYGSLVPSPSLFPPKAPQVFSDQLILLNWIHRKSCVVPKGPPLTVRAASRSLQYSTDSVESAGSASILTRHFFSSFPFLPCPSLDSNLPDSDPLFLLFPQVASRQLRWVFIATHTRDKSNSLLRRLRHA
ncbi:uncharacterized protein B0J16DRAFT_86674 [Fusarium flagelliforme]|uniref:uncharacterized protein n=1 Tax=Fusarium flagelliforme TaxID=2675880 RepID=UPI001E8D7C8A|nr:uncharacterized protein B0J16DRAFT_86674 [Fusarium flagelliforme]KAH7193864.1 hypothetical protein B0J16DRAFT_86674 [Fusarium flagelliforme]